MAEAILTTPDGKVRDYIDGTIRNETPEEYVRQTVEKRLVIEHKYVKSQIAVEFPIKMGDGKKRADIVVFPNCSTPEDYRDQHKISIIIECKKEAVNPSDNKEGIGQLKSYMAACSNCVWGMWTNGKHKTVFQKITTPTGIVFEEVNDIPSADGSNNSNERPKRTTLTKASDDNLLFTFRTCHDIISVNEGHSKQAAFFEFLKIIFCKIQDERNLFSPIEFYTTSSERHYPDGQASVYNRISKLFEQVKKKNILIFDANDEIKLEPRTVTQIVGELQKYSLLNTDIDYKGKAYEEIVGSNLRGDRGEFFTPRNVMHMAVAMLNPKEGETCLDSSCGTGGFIVSAMIYVMETLTKQLCNEYGAKEDWPAEIRSQFDAKISQVAADCFFGFDINPDLVKATKMNMVMNNDGSGNIIQLNTLQPPLLWPDDRKEIIKKAMKRQQEITGVKSIAIFDCIVTNPPFGAKIPITDHGILEQFDLGHVWTNIAGQGWTMSSDKLRNSVPPEQLFIERIIQLLRPGGRAAIVLPDSIFSSPGLEFIRVWLMHKTRIVASVDLHADTFQPHNGTQCSVLIIVKKTEEEIRLEEKTGQVFDYEIFMAMIDHIGHDKRGNVIYVRDDNGNLVMEHKTQEIRETDATGNVTVRTESFDEKIVNDQTPFVADIFSRWKEEQGITW